MTMPRRDESLEEATERTRELMSTAQSVWMDFLRVELELAHTLLDLADSAREAAARERRIALAAEAATVVERFIATRPPAVKTLGEARERLSSELSKVKERLTVAR
jgi:hypothetical protein